MYTDVVASIIALIATPEPYWIFVDSGIPQIQESQILKKSKERFTAWSLGRSILEISKETSSPFLLITLVFTSKFMYPLFLSTKYCDI